MSEVIAPETGTSPEVTVAPEGAAAPESEAGNAFAALGLDPRLAEAVTKLGYEEPTPIQREAIPPLLAGRDLVGQAATGTGKTAAFALPLLQRLAADADRARPAALVLVPTRELAMQVAEAVHRYGRPLGLGVLAVYGGQAFGPQLRSLKQGVDVVVATPGRALDHVRRGTLRLGGVSSVVLDEADEMLDMGFADDLEALLDETPPGKQTMLFSATMPPRIAAIARRHLTDPVEVRVAGDPVEPGEAPRVRQTAYVVQRAYKLAALGRVLDVEDPAATLVFCRTRTEVDQLTETLASRGYRPEALHGGLSQEQRDRVMRLFRAGTADLIVATDVAARGLDVGHLTHVVNYQVPDSPESYVHRIGRVGRAGREGVAVTLAEPREQRLLRNIERATGQRIDVARVPSVADLRARRLELTRSALRETVLAGGLDRFRGAVEELAGEFNVLDIALAAVKLAADRSGDGDEEEIPAPPPPRERDREREAFRRGPDRGPGRWSDRRAARGPDRDFDRGPDRGVERGHERGFDRAPDRAVGAGAGRAPERGFDRDGGRPARGGPRDRDRARPGMARIYVGAGRIDGVGPRDLVGAIANEAGVPGRDIGAIDIAERFSLVEVPGEVVDYVIESLRGTRILGKRVPVRRDRHEER